MKKRIFFLTAIFCFSSLLLFGINFGSENNWFLSNGKDGERSNQETGKVDDWKEIDYGREESAFFGGIQQSPISVSGSSFKNSAFADSSSLGFAVGGAKDINNFRKNIESGYFPMLSDITYEGLFYDYFFDTGKQEECDELFCPSYSTAVSKNPLTEETEYFMAVGLNSNIKESDFERKKLNLVVVLDISGSMESPFDSYHYDKTGNPIPENKREKEIKTKLEIAKESIASMLKHLKPDDRFGMVLFDDSGYVTKELRKVEDTDMEAIKKHILEIKSGGSTNMEDGYSKGKDLFSELLSVDKNSFENRIIFLTDAMPNTGDYSKESLVSMTKDSSEDGIFTSFIGIGVDFNTELIEEITKVKGVNYFSIDSEKDFRKRLDDEFEFMVTPLVFDLSLKFESGYFEIEKVYGSPEANSSTGEIMKVNTLFPSQSENGETKGGVILLKLKERPRKETSFDDTLLSASYKDRTGKRFESESRINLEFFGFCRPEIKCDFPSEFYEGKFYQNSGIQKAILLTRYVNLMKEWIVEERVEHDWNYPYPLEGGIVRCMAIEICPPNPPFPIPNFSQWERASVSLSVNGKYRGLFRTFRDYFEVEMKELKDNDLEKEIKILDELISFKKSQ